LLAGENGLADPESAGYLLVSLEFDGPIEMDHENVAPGAAPAIARVLVAGVISRPVSVSSPR
jgi:hypothetical protein